MNQPSHPVAVLVVGVGKMGVCMDHGGVAVPMGMGLTAAIRSVLRPVFMGMPVVPVVMGMGMAMPQWGMGVLVHMPFGQMQGHTQGH